MSSCDTTDMQLTSFIPLVVMDQCGGMKNKEKVPSSDCEEDENEKEGLRMMMLFVILNLTRL